jgi:hypothetical protein
VKHRLHLRHGEHRSRRVHIDRAEPILAGDHQIGIDRVQRSTTLSGTMIWYRW